MKVRLGYVALPVTLNITSSHVITYTNYKKLSASLGLSKIQQCIRLNLEEFAHILEYNIRNNIHFFRMTSKLIPLATHKEVVFDYETSYRDWYKRIAQAIKESGMRIDCHPDQYTVLNSLSSSVVLNSIETLFYHQKLFKMLEIEEPIIILHIGSSAGGKEQAMNRFCDVFRGLPISLEHMIAIENDDKVYTLVDTLALAKKLNIPMILDYHHFLCHNNGEKVEEWIAEIFHTWDSKKLVPKIHFSSPKKNTKKEKRSHHDYIDVTSFIEFIRKIDSVVPEIDIMIEAKKKDEALFRLVRQLKYETNYQFLDETTFVTKGDDLNG